MAKLRLPRIKLRRPRIPKIRRRTKVLIFFFFIFFTLLAATKIIYPEIRVLDKSFSQEIKVDQRFNSQSSYPTIISTDKFKLKINNSVYYPKYLEANKQWEILLEKTMLAEGRNTIEAYGMMDLFFVELLSKNVESVNIEVDRVAPELKAEIQNTKDFYLLENIKVDIVTEDRAKVKILDQEFEFSSQEVDEQAPVSLFGDTTQDQQNQPAILAQVLEATPKTGENSVTVTSTDSFGNVSTIELGTVKAFNDSGYTRKSCTGLIIPFSDQLQLGPIDIVNQTSEPKEQVLSRLKSEADTCTDSNVRLQIMAKGDKYQCYACGSMPSAVYIKNAEDTSNIDMANLKEYGSGKIKGYWYEKSQFIRYGFGGDYGGRTMTEKRFYFQNPKNQAWLSIEKTPFGSLYVENMDQDAVIDTIVNNMVFE